MLEVVADQVDGGDEAREVAPGAVALDVGADRLEADGAGGREMSADRRREDPGLFGLGDGTHHVRITYGCTLREHNSNTPPTASNGGQGANRTDPN